MAGPAKRMSAMDARVYEVTWGGETVGWAKDVDPSGLKFLEREKRIGELDDQLVDVEIYGIEGPIKMTLHEVDVDRIRQLMPWAAASGAFPLAPTSPSGYSMYANAKPLILHPKGVSGTASDFQFAHAFPVVTLPKSAGGKNWRELPVEFRIFIDQEALTEVAPTISGHYHGALPT